MSNILFGNQPPVKLLINHDEYWDVFACDDITSAYCFPNGIDTGCLISYIDFEDKKSYVTPDGKSIAGLESYVYESAVTTEDYSLNNIGSVGVDNGLILFCRRHISQAEFTKLYTQSSFAVPSKTTLHLQEVSGNTEKFNFAMSFSEKENAEMMNGGFYQGFFQTICDTYKVLPSELEDCWQLEFVIKKSDLEEPDKSINKFYPENKGIFFYMGTRAENKWWKYYGHFDDELSAITANKDNSFCVSGNGLDNYVDDNYLKDKYVPFTEYDGLKENYFKDGYFKSDSAISEESLTLDNGIPLIDDGDSYSFSSDNKYLIFDRTKEGKTVCTFDSADTYTFYGKKHHSSENLFTVLDRTPTGKTVCDFDKGTDGLEPEKYSLFSDLYRNSFALQITEKGALSYRYLVQDCDSENDNAYKIISESTKNGVIENDKWYDISIKIRKVSDKNMRLYFYINGYLFFISKQLDLFNFKDLNDEYERQEAVPYNISLGGGTIGLSEVIYPDFMACPDFVFPLEKNFCGTFDGYIRSFRFYDCDKEYMSIFGNYEEESKKF